MRFVVGAGRIELPASTSQMSRPANWATPRFYEIFLKVVKYVVRRIFDQDFHQTKSP